MINENYLINNIDSNYKNDIDSLLFIQDINPTNSIIRKTYGVQFDENIDVSVKMLANNTYFTPINANLFTAINNRIIALQKYLKEKEDGMVRVEFGDEPTELVEGKVWLKKR